MRRGTLTLGARYVFPVEGPPIANGVVTIEEGRIGWVGPRASMASTSTSIWATWRSRPAW